MKYFRPIVGLRAWLALWVAISHALPLAGWAAPTNPLLTIALDGHAAVLVFMILSGFVITNLLVAKQEAYAPYLARRFFRLYPIYALCCLVGLITQQGFDTAAAALPWSGTPAWDATRAEWAGIAASWAAHPLAHTVLHATLLQSLVPQEVLAQAPHTVLAPAWSLSLEWQFYLLAPLVLRGLATRRGAVLVATIALAAGAAYKMGVLGTYAASGLLAGWSQYFAIGIACRYAFEPLQRRALAALPVALAGLLVAGALVREPLPLLIWAPSYAYLVWGDASRWDGRLFARLTSARPLLLLGEASYSLYLIHWPVEQVATRIAIATLPLTQPVIAAVQVGAIAVSLLASVALYFAVERPGIALGRRVAQRLHRDDPAATPEPPPAPL